MALLTSIQFGDNNSGRYYSRYLVVGYRVHVMRHHNHVKPDSAARCNRMEVTVVTPGKTDLNLHEWYVNGNTLSGCIAFEVNSPLTMEQNKTRTICFENAQCFSISESYQIDSTARRLMKLSFCADVVTIGDVSFQKL